MYTNLTIKTILSLTILLGFYLCFIGGYGSDEDTLPMIGTFLNFLNGNFMTSRFTGYPVAEFIIGFISLYFGSFAINLVIFACFILGGFFFFCSFEKKVEKNNFFLFLLLIISSPILFFDNLEPVDYSIAFLFFSSGYYFLVKNKIELAVILFGICIGTRINFAPFVLIAIYFSDLDFVLAKSRKIQIILSSIFVGCLFYVPVWIYSELGLDWLRAGRPESGFLGYFARFIYKTSVTIGFIQLLLLIYFFGAKKYNKFSAPKEKLIFYLIAANLLIFLYIPAELSYLQPSLIFFYYLIYKYFNKKIILILIAINIFSWVIKFEPLEIIHVNKDRCAPIIATGVKLKPEFKKGYFFDYLESRSKINCWIDVNSEFGKKISKGLKLN